MVKSATRTLDILTLLTKPHNGYLHSELAALVAIPPGSLTPLLRDLVEARFVDFDPASKRYALGPRVLALSSAYLRHLNLAQVAEPILRILFDQVREFTSLVIANGLEMTKVREHAVADPLAAHLQLGESGPMHATAGGKAILAFMSAEARGAILGKLDYRLYTASTITSRAALERALEAIAKDGFAYCKEEYLDGMISIAAPVFDATEQVVGAIGVNTRSIRFTRAFERDTRKALHRATRELSIRLGNEQRLDVFRLAA